METELIQSVKKVAIIMNHKYLMSALSNFMNYQWRYKSQAPAQKEHGIRLEQLTFTEAWKRLVRTTSMDDGMISVKHERWFR